MSNLPPHRRFGLKQEAAQWILFELTDNQSPKTEAVPIQIASEKSSPAEPVKSVTTKPKEQQVEESKPNKLSETNLQTPEKQKSTISPEVPLVSSAPNKEQEQQESAKSVPQTENPPESQLNKVLPQSTEQNDKDIEKQNIVPNTQEGQAKQSEIIPAETPSRKTSTSKKSEIKNVLKITQPLQKTYELKFGDNAK